MTPIGDVGALAILLRLLISARPAGIVNKFAYIIPSRNAGTIAPCNPSQSKENLGVHRRIH